MRLGQVFSLATLLWAAALICHLVFVYDSVQQVASNHSTSQLNITNNSKASVHDKFIKTPVRVRPLPPLTVRDMSLSASFRKAIPWSGAYWNLLLNSTMTRLDTGKYAFSKNDDNCSESNPKVLHNNVQDFGSYPEMHREFLLSVRCSHPPLLIDQPDKCTAGDGDRDGQPFLLFAIKSLPRSFERRQVVRETWGKEGVHGKGLRVRLLFLLGRTSQEDPDVSQLLSYEAKVFKDVLQWDFQDSLFNLSLKEHVFYKWTMSNCPGAAFVFKGDDDVFINTKAVITYLQSLDRSQAENYYIGQLITSALPMRSPDSKYYIPETFYEGEYPPYVSGGGYVFSGALLRPLYYISRVIPFFPIDDAYTGMCFQALGISPVHHDGFQTFDIQEGDRENNCLHRGILAIHQRTPQQIKRLWRGIHSPLLTC